MHVKNFFINHEEILQKTNPQKVLGVIILISIIAYSPVFTGSEFLTYDDNWYIYENQNVINFSWQSVINIIKTPHDGQYSPLGEIYHLILYSLFGANATAFKIFALVVHLLNVSLLFKIFNRVFKSKLFVAVVVLFFAIHPMQVETIGWLSVIFRNAVTFMFLGYLFYLKYLEDNFEKYRLIPVLVCYILAFLTKEQAILFPVGLFLIYMIKSDSIQTKRFIIEMTGWALVSLVLVFITIQITQNGGPDIINRNITFFEKLGLLAKIIQKYCYNYILPHQLSFSYPTPVSVPGGSIATIFISLVLLIIGVVSSMKNKTTRFGFLWVLGYLSLAFAFSFLYVRKTFMADRYAYVAIIGFSILLYQILSYFKEKSQKNIWVGLVIVLITFSFGIMTFQRVTVFKSNKSVWSQAVEVNPQDYLANNNLASVYLKSGELDKAINFYKKALEVNPNYSLSHNNITKAYYDKKQYDSALYHVSKAIAISPNYIGAHENRSAVHLALGKKNLYLQDLNTLIALSPNNRKFRMDRAKFYFKEKQYKKSLQDAIVLIKNSNDKDSEAYSLAGNSLLTLNKFKEAEIMFSKAIQLSPEDGNNFYLRSVARVKTNRWIIALKDVVKAKEKGYKVNSNYYNMLIREVRKRNK